MKKTLLLFLTIFGLTFSNAFAEELTVERTHEKDYLHNVGYSDITADLVQRSRAKSLGIEYINPEENSLYKKQPIKFMRRFWMYLDPSLDDDSYMNHDIHTSPSIYDL